MKNKQLSKFINKAIVDLLSDAVIDEINRRSMDVLRITAVLTGADFNLYPLVIEQLNKLSEQYPVTLIFSHSAQQYLIKNHSFLTQQLPRVIILGSDLDIAKIVNTFDVLLLPELSCNSLTKCANGFADNLASELFQQAIFKQKKVVITFEYLNKLFHTLPKHYRLIIEKQIEQLSLFNAMIVPLDVINQSIYQKATNIQTKFISDNQKTYQFSSYKTQGINHKNLVTQSDIRIHDEQSMLFIDSNTLITPLAADLIKQKRIKLVKQ